MKGIGVVKIGDKIMVAGHIYEAKYFVVVCGKYIVGDIEDIDLKRIDEEFKKGVFEVDIYRLMKPVEVVYFTKKYKNSYTPI